MTDEKLIQLVQETPPEELSLEEIELLRARVVASPEVRSALADQLKLDSLLSGSLARVQVSVDEIVSQSPVGSMSNGRREWIWVAAAALLVMLGVVALFVAQSDRDQPVVQHGTIHAPAERPGGGATATTPGESSSPPMSATDKQGGEPAATTPAVAIVTEPTKPGDPKNEPWLAQLKAPPRPFHAVCFDEFRFDLDEAKAKTLGAWWQTVEGSYKAEASRRVFGLRMKGLFKLRAPWPEGVALRFAIADADRVQIHVWHGTDGVSLQYGESPTLFWTAYQAIRNGNDLRGERKALIANDNDRLRRTGKGPFELRYQNGRLVMSRGDVLLLDIPLAGAPSEVMFDTADARGGVQLCGVSLVPSEPFPLTATQPEPLDHSRPGDLKWETSLPAKGMAEFRSGPAGEAILESDGKGDAAWAWLPIDEPGLQEVIVRFDDPQPFTGAYFSDAIGRNKVQFGFTETKAQRNRPGLLTFGFTQPAEGRSGATPPQLAGQRQWLRFVAGAGKIKVWTSSDGQRWGRVSTPMALPDGFGARVGLYVGAGNGMRTIKLAYFESRQLSAIETLAPKELVEQAPAIAESNDVEAWKKAIVERQPKNVDASAWRRACAIRTLVTGAKGELSKSLISVLLSDLDQTTLESAEKLEALDELALVSEGFDQALANRVATAYSRVGFSAWEHGARRPYTLVRKSLMESPLWSNTNINVFPESLARLELLELAHGDAWDDVSDLCRQLYLFVGRPYADGARGHPEERAMPEREQLMKLVDWADALADRNLARRSGGDRNPGETTARSTPVLAVWRHPLVEQLGKEGYNVLADLEAALAGGAYKDACQVISTVTNQHATGLLPVAHDSDLFVSLPGAVTLAMRDHPLLRQTMQTEFGQVAQIRLRQAMTEADAAAIENLTVQFCGTSAAAEAHLWLGDRALSRGDFARAEGQYRLATDDLPQGERPQLAARIRLLAAMTGRDAGEPVTEPVQLGDTKLQPADFERYVSDMKARNAVHSSTDVAGGTGTTAVAGPGPGKFKLERWARLEGDMGRDPKNTPRQDIDWVANQLGITVAPSRMLVSNRFQVAAYDFATGKTQWYTALDANAGRTSQWPLVPMRPVVSGANVFVRRLLAAGPELACLDAENGKVKWRSPSGEIVSSDPVALQHKVFAVTQLAAPQDMMIISLVSFDPASGRMLEQQQLAQFRDMSLKEIPCELVLDGDTLVVVAGGCVIGCNLEGQPQWLRREIWLSSQTDPKSSAILRQRPIVADGKLFVTQPSVPAIACLDVQSGRLRWQRVLPDTVRLIGLGGDLLAAQTASGLMGLNAESGKIAWRHDADRLLDAHLFPANGGLLYAHAEAVPKQSRPRLVWLDPQTGKPRAAASLDWKHDQPMLGPVVAHEGRIWAFAGPDPREPSREIFQLAPDGPAEPIEAR